MLLISNPIDSHVLTKCTFFFNKKEYKQLFRLLIEHRNLKYKQIDIKLNYKYFIVYKNYLIAINTDFFQLIKIK